MTKNLPVAKLWQLASPHFPTERPFTYGLFFRFALAAGLLTSHASLCLAYRAPFAAVVLGKASRCDKSKTAARNPKNFVLLPLFRI